ncbi:uncharacterized protein LOC128226647 [Mya arenaria]|uniref:uncharacterized protein LOC128226647 n=1 Tax=Mya arenaria TaxID=6604 RepID=UPI0022E1EAA4|nr:uncharacterized protein LOC128226647 [Mya arenaria]
MLTVQRVRALLLHLGTTDWSVVTDIISSMVSFSEAFTLGSRQCTWTGTLWQVTGDNLDLACWDLLLGNLVAMETVLSQEQRRKVAEHIVQALLNKAEHTECNYKTPKSVTQAVLDSGVFFETGELLTEIVTQLWKHGTGTLTHSSPKKHKRAKLGGVLTSLSELLTVIGDQETPWHRDMNNESLLRLQESAGHLQQLMSDTGQSLPDMDWTPWINIGQILYHFPLVELWPCDQLRVLIGVLAGLSIAVSKGEESVCKLYLELGTRMLSSCGRLPIFQLLHVPTFLTWMLELVNNTAQKPDMLQYMLPAEVSCQALVGDYTVLEKLTPHLTQLVVEVKTGKTGKPGALTLTFFLLQEISRLWNRPYLNDSLKSACEEMYVLMARPVLKLASSVKDCTYSHHESLLVRSCTAVLTCAHKDTKIKENLYKTMPAILKWCHKVIDNSHENGNVHGRLAALWFLQTSARYHTLHASVLTMETKLALWQHLVQVVRQALNTQTPDKQPPLCIENSSEHSSSLKKTDATEYGTGHLRDSRKSRKRKHTSVSEENEMDTSSSKDNGTSDIINQVRAILQCKDDITGSEARDIGICTEPDKLATSEAIEPLDFRILVYKGHLLENGDLLVLQQTQTVMAAILVALNIDQFQDVLRQLEHDMHPSTLQSDRGKVSSSLFIWRSLLKLEFIQEQTKVVRKVAKDLMLNWQCIVERLQGWDDRSVVMEITVPLLQAQQQLLLLGKKFLPSQTVMLAMHSCVFTPLEGSTYLPAFHAVCNLLNALLVHHTETVFQNVPTFIACAKRLLLSVVEHSDQDQVSGKADVIDSLLACAYQMERLFSLIATHKLEFGKLAVYVVADYVTAVQKVTLLPAIKRGVVPAVYRMLDLCDRHAIPQLHVVLPHGLTEIFKLLYADYTKYHKYTGRV